MTARTHDLAAFTALSLVVATQPLFQITFATALTAFGANLLGGLAPDLDESTSEFWEKIPAGTVFSKLISPILGGHRFISHSLLGLTIFGILLNYLLDLASSVVLVDMRIVWWAFMIGYASHLITDSLTKEGVPWLFPIPLKLGFPPFKFLRLKTGGFVEKAFVFPGLILFNIYIYYTYYPKFLELFQNSLR